MADANGTVPSFEFATAARIVFGRGRLELLGELCQPWGRRAFVVRGGSHLETSGTLGRLEAALAGGEITWLVVRGEPDLDLVERAVAMARSTRSEFVVGIGGGSVLDTAKAVAGLTTNPGAPLDYLEVVGKGKKLVHPALPLVAIPTTAGTGSEVTRNAVILARAQKFKVSLRSELLLPRIALVDPSLTDQLPPAVTASTGLDTLTQLLEPLVSLRAGPLTDALGLMGLELVARSLRVAYADGSDRQARDEMALAALLGGICLANAGLGAVHGLAAPLGASFPVPHAVACATLLPHVVEKNLAALESRSGDSSVLARYERALRALVGPGETGSHLFQAGVAWLRRLVADLGIPGLAEYGVRPEHFDDLVARARQASSMRTNPVELTEEELRACLEAAL